MKLRTELETMQKICSGQNVFIIAGGPSLATFDFSLLQGKICIALNSAYSGIEHLLKAIYWTDNDWASKHYDNLMNFNGLKFHSRINGNVYLTNNRLGFANACVLNKLGDFGFSNDINCVYGNNSGAQAINFIANMKPYRIILLGYDMGFSRGKTHWHEGYITSDSSVYRELFIPSIEAMAPAVLRLGIDVVNCNEESNLNCFRKDNLQRYL